MYIWDGSFFKGDIDVIVFRGEGDVFYGVVVIFVVFVGYFGFRGVFDG